MRAPDLITDAELAAAEAVHTRDPADHQAAGHQLWGNKTAESQADPENIDPRILEVTMPSDDHVALLAFIDRLERVKKKLPPDVAVLRRNLSD